MIPSERLGQLSVVCVLGASVMFSLNDVSVKWLSGGYPLHQIVLMRALIALVITLSIAVPLEGGWERLRTRRPMMHVLRGLCVVIANMAFFCSIVVVSLAEATAIFFVAPLLITGFSAVFLKEPVGIRRWLALTIGFVGVLVIVQPGAVSFQWAVLLPVVAAVAYATLHTLTRNMGLSERASTMALYIQLTFIVVCSGMGLAFGDGRFAGTGNPALEFLFRAWQWPLVHDWPVIALTGIFSAAGGYLISQAYRLGEAGLVAPFEYTVLVLAVIWGYVIWDELPDTLSAFGILLILGSGVFVAVRETRFGVGPSARRISGRR
ncbi:MAG: DMT family transporter [Paracoccaceae bacterium]|nr:DMT family transporter [Paracoccaceae bacterium]